MYIWVIYDISSNKKRKRVAIRCKQLGLVRVQKSVFLGEAPQRLLRRFKAEIPQLINLRKDRLFIVPMDKQSYKKMKQYGVLPPAILPPNIAFF